MCRPVNAFRGLGVETARRTSSARLQRIACCAGTPDVSKRQRRQSESNRRIEVLQTSALPLGYGAVSLKLAIYLDFLNPPLVVRQAHFKAADRGAEAPPCMRAWPAPRPPDVRDDLPLASFRAFATPKSVATAPLVQPREPNHDVEQDDNQEG